MLPVFKHQIAFLYVRSNSASIYLSSAVPSILLIDDVIGAYWKRATIFTLHKMNLKLAKEKRKKDKEREKGKKL